MTKKNFEESLKELESIVSKLESGDLGLEQSLEQFEVGTKLYKVCKEQLSVAEKKISLLTESLKEEELPEQSKEEIDDILEASNTLLDIVNGILDISKIEANRVEIVNSNYNFDKIFNELKYFLNS